MQPSSPLPVPSTKKLNWNLATPIRLTFSAEPRASHFPLRPNARINPPTAAQTPRNPEAKPRPAHHTYPQRSSYIPIDRPSLRAHFYHHYYNPTTSTIPRIPHLPYHHARRPNPQSLIRPVLERFPTVDDKRAIRNKPAPSAERDGKRIATEDEGAEAG